MAAIRKSTTARQQEIVEATPLLLPEPGEDHFSIQMIADHAGITRAGLFRQFPPGNLWLAELPKTRRRARRAFTQTIRECGPTVLRLWNILVPRLRLNEDCRIHLRITTALLRRASGDLATAVEECVPRRPRTGREYDLAAKGDRLIRSHLRVSGARAGGDRS